MRRLGGGRKFGRRARRQPGTSPAHPRAAKGVVNSTREKAPGGRHSTGIQHPFFYGFTARVLRWTWPRQSAITQERSEILVYTFHTFSPLQIQSAVCRRPPIVVVELGASRLQQIKTEWHAQSMPCAPTGARETDALASLGLERSRVGVLSCVVFLATTMSAGLAVEGQLRGARKQPTSSPS